MKAVNTIISLLELSIFAFMLGSCESDEPVEKKSYLYKITVPENAIANRETERWFWVTNQKNQLVHTERVSDNHVFEIAYPTDHTDGDAYSITVLSFYQDATSYFVSTYLQADAGDYMLRSTTSFQRTPIGNFSLTVNNAPGAGLFIRGKDLAEGGALNTNGTVLTATVPLTKNPGSVTCFFLNSTTSAPRFKKLNDVPIGSSQVIDYNDFAPMEIERHFSFPGARYTSFSISAAETENDKISFVYSLYSNQFFSGNKDVSIYFSNAIAPKVQTSISYATEDRTFSYIHLDSQPPSSFREISAQIIHSSAENNRINIATSGTYDAAATTAIYYKDLDDVTWTWYYPSVPQTVLEKPVIPSEILSNHPSLAQNFSSISTVLYDYAGEVDYNQFVQNSIRGSFFNTLSNELSSVQSF